MTTGACSMRPRTHGHVARVIGDAVLLFVGSLVLLVDDDQRQVA